MKAIMKVRNSYVHVVYKPRTGKAETTPSFIVPAARLQIP